MAKINIDYGKINLFDYSGAGNKISVLDISKFIVNTTNPDNIRISLENNIDFRRWLGKEGKKHDCDSVMIYYSVADRNYDFVTFVGEPNGDPKSRFSEMCGNGLRCLSLHILLTCNDAMRMVYLREGIKIYAGQVRKLEIMKFEKELKQSLIKVNLGEYFCDHSVEKYLNGLVRNKTGDYSCLKLKYPDCDLINKFHFSIGLNGEQGKGEPHLVLMTDIEGLCLLSEDILKEDINAENIFSVIRRLTCVLGNFFTFNTEMFPEGINFNIGVYSGNYIYVSTHERNLNENREACRKQQERYIYCKCNTLSCGTGGAAVFNIYRSVKQLRDGIIITNHSGGILKYYDRNGSTFMIGKANAIY